VGYKISAQIKGKKKKDGIPTVDLLNIDPSL
jgi:hypothetical protein